jgi:hypothetical protein
MLGQHRGKWAVQLASSAAGVMLANHLHARASKCLTVVVVVVKMVRLASSI